MSETHYVFNIEVTKVVKHPATTGDRYGNGAQPEHRETSTIARVVVPADTVENGVGKASAHLLLIEDGGDIDSRKTR